MSAEIAVVAATHNRRDRLAALLDALRAQTIGTERFEVVIVDDGDLGGHRSATVRSAAEAAGILKR